MNDPVYDNGVNTASLLNTMEDVYAAINGKTDFVRLPVPLNGHPPVYSLSLVGRARDVPHQLDVNKNDNMADIQGVSRRMYCKYASSQSNTYTSQDVGYNYYPFMNRMYDTHINDDNNDGSAKIEDLVDSISDEIRSISAASKAHDESGDSEDDVGVNEAVNPSAIPETLDIGAPAENPVVEDNNQGKIGGRRRFVRRNLA